MADRIQILSDAVANQIAAGEVIQRPASAVKELVENAIDAGATEIKLVFREGGKNFIQVIDNGSGMSETDARMSFERHATSKIRKADDLFAITTKGFRGEALASIAAVAKVNLKTRRAEDAIGVQIEIDGSELIVHEPCACPAGTVFTIKSLFYNVPARRKFLKSDAIETKHILDEFHRIALSHPEVAFQLYNGDNAVYQLEAGTFRQRIVGLFGNSYNEKVVPVEEETDLVKISGFIVKPEFARKTRGEQFFFVNNRFIKSPYLHHALSAAFEELLPKEEHPGYFIKLTVDPSRIDINIHPTKTEVKFEDERIIYAILGSAVRKGLGKYNITPSLDFDREAAFDIPFRKRIEEVPQPGINVNPEYNPFNTSKSYSGGNKPSSDEPDAWLVPLLKQQPAQELPDSLLDEQEFAGNALENLQFFQLFNRYIVAGSRQGLLVIDQHRAHERIIFERLLEAMEKQGSASQMELFAETLHFNPADMALVEEMMDELRRMGFDMEHFGSNAIVIRGIPADAVGHDVKTLLESLLEQYKNSQRMQRSERRENLARILANRMAVRSGMVLNKMEMERMISELFYCKMPYVSPGGKPVLYSLTPDELDEKFLKHRF